MTFRRYAALPWLVALAVVATGALAPEGSRAAALVVWSEAVKAAALAGCLLAAREFGPGDYMRAAWGLNGACFALLLARDVTLLTDASTAAGAAQLALARGALVTLANVASVVGTWKLARALAFVGLALAGSRARRLGATTFAALVAAAIAGGPFLADARGLVHGDWVAVVALASDLGDMISLALIAPVVLTAMTVRGGRLAWPWSFLAAGLVSWLLYDATAQLAVAGVVLAAHLTVAREALRALACTFIVSAALAHRAIARSDAA